ncbi:MAG TPA: OB-fold domain-containing protein [Acidimicrobiales bacterium]|nr:OB-fold domain-containing protein [Acidimicrobiales bacterium]
MAPRGILSYGAYLPYRRLDRSEIRPVAGTGGGAGTRTVASYDEDATTMGVAAARTALAAAPRDAAPASLWFATTSPPYLDKTNATALHAALRLPAGAPAFDVNGAVRSAVGALRAGLGTGTPALVVAGDIRTGRPGSPDEATGGDGAAALLVGTAYDGPLLAEVVATVSATEEFLDRWRTPGDAHSKVWEERFGETRYVDLGLAAWHDALAGAGLAADAVDRVVVATSHARAGTALGRKLGLGDRLDAGLDATVGFTGAAHPALLLARALDAAGPGETIAVVVLADGADVLVVRTTEALVAGRPAPSVADQVAAGGPVPYGKALAWRGHLPVEPPRRPEPARPSASAAARSRDWKFGFVASQDGAGHVHLPPAPGDDRERPMADSTGTVVTYTVDRLAYSPSPPVVFAVVDFDGGGRLPVELTDVDPDDVAIGGRVEMTFRKLFTADGIHNYFWKACPVRTAGAATSEGS